MVVEAREGKRSSAAATDDRMDRALGQTALDTDPAPRPGALARLVELGKGDEVGRYVILDELGRGGMGVVFEAYDPDLDRRVALKLLHRSLGGTAQPWILREAQSMAQLNHPNVVTVYDVGEADERIYVATLNSMSSSVVSCVDEKIGEVSGVTGSMGMIFAYLTIQSLNFTAKFHRAGMPGNREEVMEILATLQAA